MPSVAANGISVAYEEAGDRKQPTILLIMGLGQQLIAWPNALLDLLVQAGFHVVRFDNRDAGQSTAFKNKRPANPAVLYFAARLGLPWPVAYTLTDMADDALALLHALGISAAHLVGVSMGGMIAQIAAAKGPERVLSLTSIMSTSGARGLPEAAPEIQARLFKRPSQGATREQLIDFSAETLQLISYPDPQRPPDTFRLLIEQSVARGYNPLGYVRQLQAIIADGSRVRRLTKIKAPTLVIHGATDNLIPVACGIDTAKHVPGAHLEILEQMAHDLPPSQLSRLASLIITHARSAKSG